MDFYIRIWREEDVPQLVQLNFQWGYETTAEKMIEHLIRIGKMNNAEVFVAEVDGKVAGRILVTEHVTLGSTPFAEIYGLVVDENYRKRGIGKALIEKAKEWSREKGFNVLRLRTNINREEANSFYSAIGFTLEKRQNVYQIKSGEF